MSKLPAIAADPESEGNLSPEMAALKPSHRAFVMAKIMTGANNTQAAIAAGYSGAHDTLRATAYRIAHRPDVLAAIRAEAERLLFSASAVAMATLVELASPEWPDAKIRLKAAESLLSRAGFGLQSQHTVVVSKDTDQMKVDKIVALARNVGVDPRVFLGRAGVETDANFRITKIIDAEYVEAPHDDLADVLA